jgi:uncharacterized protein (DUF1015 family)
VPTVRPFTGLLYDPAVAGEMDVLTAPPYDQVSPREARRLRQASSYNIVRLDLGTSSAGADPSRRHARAGQLLAEWRDLGVLTPSEAPSVYPYEMRYLHDGEQRRLRGVVAAVDIASWGGGIIPHERTLIGPVEDRLELLKSIHANLSPIYAVFEGQSPALPGLLEDVMITPPARHVVDEGGTAHSLWDAPDVADEISSLLVDESLMIADGHHRYAVALAFREQMRATFGAGPWDQVMMLIVDAGTENPLVLPFHRVLSSVIRPPREGRRVRDLQEVLAGVRDEDPVVGMASHENGELTHRLVALDGSLPAVSGLHAQILAGMPEESMRYVPDAVEAEERVRGGAPAAFFLPPMTVARVRSIVASGDRLPEKSTYFWPKPRTGMVIRAFDPGFDGAVAREPSRPRNA